MSKYVKEMMMDQLRSDLDGSRSLLILDLKDLDAMAEHGLRRDLRKKSIRLRVLEEFTGPPCFRRHGHGWALEVLEGPLGDRLGRRGDHRAGQGALGPGEGPQEARDQGRGGRGGGCRPGAGRRYHQAPQPRGLDRPGDRPVAGPARQTLALLSSPSSTVVGQLEALAKRQEGEGRRKPPRPPPRPADAV